jgi:hypothetical protein
MSKNNHLPGLSGVIEINRVHQTVKKRMFSHSRGCLQKRLSIKQNRLEYHAAEWLLKQTFVGLFYHIQSIRR